MKYTGICSFDEKETAVLYFTCHLPCYTFGFDLCEPCYTSIWNWYMWTGSRVDMLLMRTCVNAPLSHLNADNACIHFTYIILYDPLCGIIKLIIYQPLLLHLAMAVLTTIWFMCLTLSTCYTNMNSNEVAPNGRFVTFFDLSL